MKTCYDCSLGESIVKLTDYEANLFSNGLHRFL